MTRLAIEPTLKPLGDPGELVLPSPGAVLFDEAKEYVRQAISEGDLLPNTFIKRPSQTRALIIAPVYREPGQKYASLLSDAADVKLVHQMLLHFGYERRDIRILCDVCGGFNGRADPTRENILQSLEWLVEGANPGDHRFLHFSGHGDRILGDSVSGKRARRVEPRLNIPGAWNVDTERSSARIFSGRVTEQAVAEDELIYYNEAIITRLTEVRDGSAQGECADKILDSELNHHLSRLPEGCTITSIMDCCASGRILNLSHKLLGSGFRGSHENAVAQNQSRFSNNSSIDQETITLPSPAPITESTVPSISAAVSIMMKVVPRLMQYARGVMQEGIPDQERDLDHIKARIFAWGACHQRQESWETNDRSAGLFTQTFTETCMRLAGSNNPLNKFTYNQLFNEVSRQVAEKRADAGLGWGNSKPAPQFVQLWTSLKNVDRAAEASLLDSPVAF